ncbi:hypothetical protein CANTEDRAFT_129281 [Yamadazyma tenuis ATCC 10573]|uniref:Nitrogen regulatory protein areA GATA-like domain-containing protein n=1 Tax=Candida tenuis (strain ATCC 10573 / BCRC 21748 / CBS 615 / JCM 9827 / NBRC 10315 / NRRL Y-1498 / VKM Y-70) TaxID=590646 RepID=G3AYD4_CANTC|nr:uncharacterized protein CANTEDRAFT_129281 [Yamadazyma tenuis ATCC 10573]EGV65826.1 hypothetical protein CANTEDRAFT_129281 [Yamadazyma tenuis ATCC 10573]
MGKSHNINEVFTGGATTSQHIDAEDDDHFNNTTFKLKRTRSLGLLDEFISPLEEANKQENKDSTREEQESEAIEDPPTNTSKPTDNKLSINTSLEDQHTENDKPDSDKAVKTPFSPEFIPHDDNDIIIEPSIHVDYFSHQWDVSDISKSWRYIIQKRKDVANSARLENASWRTWAQRRSNLKTINPKELNWSKENDITWLYGPIVQEADASDDEHDEHEEHHKSTTATSKVAGDISIPNKPTKKSILKKRSVQDMMISHANLVKLEAMENRMKLKKAQRKEQLRKYNEENKGHKRTSSNEPPEFDDYEAISEKLNSQYRVSSNQSSSLNLIGMVDSKSNPNIVNENNLKDLDKQISNIDLGDTISVEPKEPVSKQSSNASNTDSISDKKSRRIHFNDVVEQCIAVDVIEDDSHDYDSNFSDEEEDNDEEYEYYNNESNKSQQSFIFTGHNDFEDTNDPDILGNDSDSDSNDEDGGFFLKVKSPSSSSLAPPSVSRDKQLEQVKTQDPYPGSQSSLDADATSISTTSSRIYRTIQLLPSTTLNYGSDEASSDEENPYTSSLSHNVNSSSSRGYDYYYDYNTVYTVDPNQGGYGDSANNNTPDVVDLPEDLAPYSSYDSVTEGGHESLPIIDSQVINNNVIYNNSPNTGPHSSLTSPTNLPGPGLPRSNPGGFSLNDSDSDSDSDSEDEGLSISTRSSSQSLAQQAYQSMTPANTLPVDYENKSSSGVGLNPTPVSNTVSSINPRHSSSTGLSKQSISSNSLTSQFFGTTPIRGPSSTSLADQFFNMEPSSSNEKSSPRSYPQQTQRKASPLPPHTTSANAFSGNTTPPLEKQIKRNKSSTFTFDSDSESEEEFVEDVQENVVQDSPTFSSPNSFESSYNSLSQVAGKNGIGGSEEAAPRDKNIVNQARGLANHFLGNWKHNES